MRAKLLQWLGIVLIVQMGLLHFFTAQRLYEEAAYLGYLFMANFLASLLAAWGIYHRRNFGWLMGGLTAAGSITGFVLSRTTGLPGVPVEQRVDAYGIAALIVEIIILLVLVLRPWRADEPAEAAGTNWMPIYLAPLAGLALVACMSMAAYAWDARLNTIPLHEHVGSLAEVCSTPITSLSELRDKYGIEISLVAMTQMDGVVDVRLKVIDPDKAHNLLVNQAALLVNQDALILAPHLHTHYKLKPDKLFFMFFSSMRGTIHTGTAVSLVFGRTRVEPIIVQ